MSRITDLLRWIVNSWEVQLAGGLILLVTTFYYYENQTALHHGFRGLVILHIIGTIPDLIQALERTEKGLEKGLEKGE